MNRILAALTALALSTGSVFAQDAENVLVITVDGQSSGTIEIELLPDVAPKHVERIKELARSGAYDNVVFHRVIEGFMAQTGDVQFGVEGNDKIAMAGRGASELPDLPAEFSDIPYEAGTVGMARSQSPNSANSQFFITFDEASFLNGQYTVFGKVIAGQEVVDAIKLGDQAANGAVDEPDVMRSVQVKADIE